MKLRLFGRIFKAKVSVGMTPHGPGLDVHRHVLGVRIPVGQKTFAKHADRFMSRIAAWPPRKPAKAPLTLADHRAAMRRSYQGMSGGNAMVRRRLLKAHQYLTQYGTQPSSAWAARCDAMERDGTFAAAPEIQAAAHLHDVAIEVLLPNNRNGYTVKYTANPKAAKGSIRLVLENKHFKYTDFCPTDPTIKKLDRPFSFKRDSLYATLVKDVPMDGNCLFHCLSRSIPFSTRDPAIMRARVVAAVRRLEKAPLDGSDGITLGEAFLHA